MPRDPSSKSAPDQLLRHAIGDLVGRDAGAIAFLPDLFEPAGDLRDALPNLVDVARRLVAAAEIFERHADDPAGIDHIIRRVEDATLGQRLAVVGAGELIVRRTCDDRAVEPGDALIVENRAERIGAENLARVPIDRIVRDRLAAKLVGECLRAFPFTSATVSFAPSWRAAVLRRRRRCQCLYRDMHASQAVLAALWRTAALMP